MTTSQNSKSLYPEASSSSSSSSSTSSLYVSLDSRDYAENIFQEDDSVSHNPINFQSSEEILINIPGAIVHLIEKDSSVELACGELKIVGLRQGNNIVAVLTRIGDDVQWPLAKDEPAVKLDESHYFFTLRVPKNGSLENDSNEEKSFDNDLLNYGLTIASKGQEDLLKELDRVLETYSCFSVQKIEGMESWEVLDGSVARETSPDEFISENKRELIGKRSDAYWTTLAPNVEDYSGRVARLIAAGSGQMIRGILWCGDVTVDRLKWGHEFFKIRMSAGNNSEISPEALKRMKRVKKMTKMSEIVVTGILSGVVKVSDFFTGSIVNSKAGQKFFSLPPGEVILASFDGFNKVWDAIEVSGRNVLSTSSEVTKELVSQRYGEASAKVTNEGLDAAGHAFGTAWAVFKITKALNPKSVIKPATLAKAAARANAAESMAKGKKK